MSFSIVVWKSITWSGLHLVQHLTSQSSFEEVVSEVDENWIFPRDIWTLLKSTEVKKNEQGKVEEERQRNSALKARLLLVQPYVTRRRRLKWNTHTSSAQLQSFLSTAEESSALVFLVGRSIKVILPNQARSLVYLGKREKRAKREDKDKISIP